MCRSVTMVPLSSGDRSIRGTAEQSSRQTRQCGQFHLPSNYYSSFTFLYHKLLQIAPCVRFSIVVENQYRSLTTVYLLVRWKSRSITAFKCLESVRMMCRQLRMICNGNISIGKGGRRGCSCKHYPIFSRTDKIVGVNKRKGALKVRYVIDNSFEEYQLRGDISKLRIGKLGK